MPTTYRLDKGSALTYQELDDNFREAAGNPNVRWLKIKSAELDQTLNIIPGDGDSDTLLKWKNVAHTDAAHFSLAVQNSIITFEKNGVYRINANVVISFLGDSSITNSIEMQILKNDQTISKVFHIPNRDTESSQSLVLQTIEEFSTSDTLKIKLLAKDAGSNVSYSITEDEGELVLEWAGYNP
jgi:hypothetical protein